MSSAPNSAPVTVIVPCLNEEAGLPALLARLRQMRNQPGIRDWHFLFVDDGSTDATFSLLLQAARDESWVDVVRHHQNQGLGAALRTGFAHTQAPIVCTMDSDCTYPPERLPELTALVARGSDIATASPWHPDNAEAQGTAFRILLSRGASLIYRILIGQDVHTFTCLFRAYRHEVVQSTRVRARGFAAVAELMLRAILAGRTITEVAMPLESRKYGESKLRISDAIVAHLGLVTLTAVTVASRHLLRILGR